MIDREKIRRRVESLLRAHDVTAPPVPVEKIARALGVRVHRLPFEEDLSGMIYLDGKTPIIGVNAQHHPNRRRFTVAHELGHLLLHRKALAGKVHVDRRFPVLMRDATSASGLDSREIEANQFAAEMLMPLSLLLPEIQRKKAFDIDDDKPVTEIANRFRVSKQALQFRLLNLS